MLSAILERIGSRVRPPELSASPVFETRLAALSLGGLPVFLLMAGLMAARIQFALAESKEGKLR